MNQTKMFLLNVSVQTCTLILFLKILFTRCVQFETLIDNSILGKSVLELISGYNG